MVFFFFFCSGLCTVTADCKHWTEEISSSVEDLVVDWYFLLLSDFYIMLNGSINDVYFL